MEIRISNLEKMIDKGGGKCRRTENEYRKTRKKQGVEKGGEGRKLSEGEIKKNGKDVKERGKGKKKKEFSV